MPNVKIGYALNDRLPGVSVVAAVFLSLVAAGSAHAGCEWSDRIEVDSAECLAGEWENRTWPDKDTAWVESKCSDLGTVVAKVDRQGAADWTKWLENASRVNMSGAYGNVRGIHCCKDLGDLCNVSDIVNSDNCIAAFKTSEAFQGTSEGERFPTVQQRRCDPMHAEGAGENCEIDAQCEWWEARHQADAKRIERRQITVHYNDVPKLVLSREGQLSVGGD